MSARPLETTEADPKSNILEGGMWLGAIIFGGIFGAFGFILGGPLVGAGVFAVIFALLLVWPVVRDRSITFELYDDRAVSDHILGGSEVSYWEVAFVVRSEGSGDRRRGTADFEFVREDRSNVTFDNVVDPDRVESILEDHLPSAGEWMRNHTQKDTALWAIQRHRWWHDWHYGDLEHDEAPFEIDPHDKPDFIELDFEEPDLPQGVDVLSSDEFETLTDVSAEAADLDALDSIDDVDDVSDIDASDVEAGGDGDGGGGGFDGGGGGE